MKLVLYDLMPFVHSKDSGNAPVLVSVGTFLGSPNVGSTLKLTA